MLKLNLPEGDGIAWEPVVLDVLRMLMESLHGTASDESLPLLLLDLACRQARCLVLRKPDDRQDELPAAIHQSTAMLRAMTFL